MILLPFPYFLRNNFPYTALLCLVVLSLSGSSASYLQWCVFKAERWWKSHWKQRRVFVLVLKSRHFIFAPHFIIPSLPYTTKGEATGTGAMLMCAQTAETNQHKLSAHTLMNFPCDICCTCRYLKFKENVDFTIISICRKGCHSVYVLKKHFTVVHYLWKCTNSVKWKRNGKIYPKI